ncbi:unnamed protein product [Symbiodinium natans]|uniref:Uncharacterized protein n=1 Tax=Symbiodinium natans TaxID=878477 RepID=A0A812NNS0_9DINO|nr:unnamed protein product [Symbiodinium natans]
MLDCRSCVPFDRASDTVRVRLNSEAVERWDAGDGRFVELYEGDRLVVGAKTRAEADELVQLWQERKKQTSEGSEALAEVPVTGIDGSLPLPGIHAAVPDLGTEDTEEPLPPLPAPPVQEEAEEEAAEEEEIPSEALPSQLQEQRQAEEIAAEKAREEQRRVEELAAEKAREEQRQAEARAAEKAREAELRQKEQKEEEERARRQAREKERQQRVEEFLQAHGFVALGHAKRVQDACGLPFMARTVYPIHVAAELADAGMVEMMIQEGADPTQRTSNGKTASELARKRNKGGSHDAVLRALSSKAAFRGGA